MARKPHKIHITLCMKFYWNIAAPTDFWRSVAVFMLPWQSRGAVATETVQPAKPKISTIWRFQEKFAKPWSKAMGGDKVGGGVFIHLFIHSFVCVWSITAG